MIQQGLDLSIIPDRHADARLLIQKNECGNWAVSGIAMRVGGPGSPTTNLIWKGGAGLHFEEEMCKFFGAERAAAIREECDRMALEVVLTIEQHFGSMLEFGLDVGIDVDGRVWLIEANPKPTQSLFLCAGEREIYNLAVRRPIEYAMFLASEPRSSAPDLEV